jgi:anti-anti-sigma factor
VRRVDYENAVVLAVAGEVDLSNATQLGAIFEYVQRDNPRVLVIDLSRVAFLGSAGLRTLVEARHRAGDDAVRVVAAFGSARRAIETTALDQVLPLFFTVDDALETNLA